MATPRASALGVPVLTPSNAVPHGMRSRSLHMGHDLTWVLVCFACLIAGKAIAMLICRKGARR